MSDSRDKYWFNDIRDISTIRELLEGSAEQYPDRPAFWVKAEKGKEYTPVKYALLRRDVYSLAAALHDRGLLSGRVGIMGQGCYEWIVTYLAVVTGGGVAVPIDKELDPRALENVLRTAECTAVFYTDTEAEKFTGAGFVENHFIMHFYGDRTDPEMTMAKKLEDRTPGKDIPACVPDTVTKGTWKELIMEGEELVEEGKGCLPAEEDPERMSVLLFTSGTTGMPKGVMLSQRNITASIMDTCRIANIHPSDITLSILPIHHTYECTFGMLLVLYRGASTAFCEGLKYITKNMSEIHNTVLIAVPMVLEMIYSKIWKTARKQGRESVLRRAVKLSNSLKCIGIDVSRKLFRQIHQELGGGLRMVITGAAALYPNVIRGFEDIGITVLQGYGLTECTPLVAGTPEKAKERYRKAGSVGVAVAGGEFRLVDTDEDGIGEVEFRGPNLMLGYYNMPEETAAVVKDGWFATGDLGLVDDTGWLYLTGRKKNVIVTKSGKNIYPEEIEEVINKIEAVTECMAYGKLRGNEDTVALQVLPDLAVIAEALGHKPDDDEVYSFIKNAVNEANMTMPSYKRVRDVIIRKEDFIRTTTKKIRRQDNIPKA